MNIDQGYLNSDFRNYRKEELDILDRYVAQMSKHMDVPEIAVYNWPRLIRNQEITRFLVFYEVYKQIKDVHGCIMEMGVLDGNTMFSLAHFVEIFEHRNYTRLIYGFDTFNEVAETSMNNKDASLPEGTRSRPFNFELLEEAVQLFNDASVFNQFRRINLVKGDCVETVPKFLEENPHIICALLVLHISLYEPEIAALKAIWPRMPKGGIVLLASLGHYDSPSPTHVVEDVIGISNARIQRFPFATKHSYIVKE